MRYFILFALVFIATFLELKAQVLNDWIVTKNYDTIHCNITLVNDQNIFYQYQSKKKVKNDNILKSMVIDYKATKAKILEPARKFDSIVFLGYDFSHFKIIDPKRKNQDIVKFINIWTDYINETVDTATLSDWLNTKVNFNQTESIKLNNSLNRFLLASETAHKLSSDSIPAIISRLNIDSSAGNIALIVIYEAFSDENKTISGYYVLFDTNTKEILKSKYLSTYFFMNYNRVREWGYAMRQGLLEFSRQINL